MNNKEEVFINLDTEEIVIEDDEEDEIIEVVPNINNNKNKIINEIDIIINENGNNNNIRSFTNLTEQKTTQYKALYMDQTKFRKSYKNNYIFKSQDQNIIRKIYDKIKAEHKLIKGIIVEQVINNETYYISMVYSKNFFHINNFMKDYLTFEYNHGTNKFKLKIILINLYNI